MTEHASYWRSPAVWLVLAAGFVFTALGLRSIFDPTTAALGFGLPVGSETGFIQVYGSRNVALGLLAIALVWMRQLRAVLALLSLALLLPFVDMTILVAHVGVGAHLIRHAVIWSALALIAATVLQRVRREAGT